QPVAGAPADTFEYPPPAEPREPQFRVKTPADAVAHGSALVEQFLRRRDAIAERARPGPRQVAVLEIRFRRAARARDLARHVQPAGAPIAAEILPEIRQLQRGAQRIGRPIEPVV